MKRKLFKISLSLALISLTIGAAAQSPGGVGIGLRTWYKGDAFTPVADGTDISSWPDQYSGDGATQNAVQNGRNLLPSLFGNRQPQYRVAIPNYNFHPYIDFSKNFSSLFAYQAHSVKADYTYNYSSGATLYQVGSVFNTQGDYAGTGLGGTTAPIGGYRYEFGVAWKGLNALYNGNAYGFYEGTVSDYGYYTYPFPPYSYNYNRSQRKIFNNIPYISAVSYDKYSTYNTCCVVSTGASTAIQTRINGDSWNWGYSYTPAGPSLFIGNEYTNYNTGRWWKGGIPEVVLYNRRLSSTQGGEADRVDTYLALKYGITLYHNYYLSNGTKVWDSAFNNKYNKDIAGIAKDNSSALNQKQSHSVNKKPVITMSAGSLQEYDNDNNTSVISDTYSMIWGSNGSSVTLKDSRSIPGGFSNLQSNTIPNTVVPAACLTTVNMVFTQRKWLVQEQSGKDAGSVKVYIESKELGAIDWTCPNSAYIVVGTDQAFSNPKFYPLMLATGTLGSTTDYVADINFCEGAPNASTITGSLKGQYFAIAGKAANCNCGGVPGYTAWVRAENGKAYSDTATSTLTNAEYGQPVRRVYNFSGGGDGYWKYDNLDGVNAAYNNATYQGIFGAPSAYSNFNPTIDFSSNIFPGFVFSNILTRASTSAGTYSFADTATAFASTYHLETTASLPAIKSQVWGAGYAGNVPGFIVYGNSSAQGPGIISSGAACTFVGPTMVAPFTMVAKRNYQTTWSTAFDGTYCSTLYPKFKDSASMNGRLLANTLSQKYIGDNLASQTRHNDLTLRGSHDLDPNLHDWPTSYNAAYKPYSLHEAIYYERLLTEQEKDRVESYLGIRNGETILNAQYLASDAGVIWDTASYTDAFINTGGYTRYNASITGIGRDDASCLMQKASRNTEDTTITISIGKIPVSGDQEDIDADYQNDKEFIIWGSNGANQNARITTDLPATLPGCIDSRLAREYHVHLTGSNTGNYATQLRWQLDNNLLDAVSATSISLLIDDDGDGNFNTGTIRSIPATSYDVATNSIIFDKVTLSVAGDASPSEAAITVGWGQTSVGKAILFNGTAGGGGNCTCAGASAVLSVLCTDAAGWTFYKNPLSNNKVVAINWGSNAGISTTVSLDATTAAASRRKTNLNVANASVITDSAAVVGARLLNVTINSGTITSPVKVRFYYDRNELSSDSLWIFGSSGVNETIRLDSSMTWFKYEGTVANAISSLSASGLPVATDVVTAHPGTIEKLIPDEAGIEDGINYVQFNYVTGFSTFGYMFNYVRNNDISVLPVTLLSFNGKKSENCTAILNWKTNNEINIKHYEVEQSIDFGNSWKTIVRVEAKNTLTDNSYSKEVSMNPSINNYYRLKITDLDGTGKYSQIIVLRCEGLVKFSVIPNPVSSSALISGIEPGSDIQVFTSNGKLVLQLRAVSNTQALNVLKWPSGSYLIRVYNSKSKKYDSQKIIKN